MTDKEKPIINNATACYLRRPEETLFLYRNRGEGDIHDGWFVPPGGHTERGERGIDCIRREVKEETGLVVIKPRLRVIATFYNAGRILGGKKNPEDWCVEIFETYQFRGDLREEHPKAKPSWIRNSELKGIKIYPGDRRIMDLLDEEGVFEVLAKYRGNNLIRFDYERVA